MNGLSQEGGGGCKSPTKNRVNKVQMILDNIFHIVIHLHVFLVILLCYVVKRPFGSLSLSEGKKSIQLWHTFVMHHSINMSADPAVLKLVDSLFSSRFAGLGIS